MPSAMKALTQLRLAAPNASSVGQACFHAGNIACNSLNNELTTSTVPGGNCLEICGETRGRLPMVLSKWLALFGARNLLTTHPGRETRMYHQSQEHHFVAAGTV